MERRGLGEDLYALVATSLEQRGFLAAFTERTGGVSASPFASLDLGFHTGDHRQRVRENRKRVIAALDTGAFTSGRQVHGGGLARVGARRAGAGFEDPGTAFPGVDALAVSGRGLPVAVLVADCVPFALASPSEGRLVVGHAGWRGLVAGLVERTVAAFDRPAGAYAAIGPSIGPCHYEVGEDVALAVVASSETGAVTHRRGGAVFLDLPATVTRRLRVGGVRRVEVAGLCTACEEGRFFSYRRDGVTGRQALIAERR